MTIAWRSSIEPSDCVSGLKNLIPSRDIKRRLTAAGLPAQPVTGLHWPDFGRTTTLNVAIYCALVNSIQAGQLAYEPVGEMRETLYGSEDVPSADWTAPPAASF
jgi:hypothetical protein